MVEANPSNQLIKLKQAVASRVRDLRAGRRWTQGQLAAELGVSQGRLSDLERGKGSFSAEQLLLLLKLFNVTASHFVPARRQDRGAELQNALARVGALHLYPSNQVFPAEELDDVDDIVHGALILAAPRHLTALAPVLVVASSERLSLRTLHARLVESGLERRLAWVIENTLEAVRRERAKGLPRAYVARYRRAELVLETFLESLASEGGPPVALDLLDATVASPQTRRRIEEASSEISKRWRILSDLTPDDFAGALEAARAEP